MARLPPAGRPRRVAARPVDAQAHVDRNIIRPSSSASSNGSRTHSAGDEDPVPTDHRPSQSPARRLRLAADRLLGSPRRTAAADRWKSSSTDYNETLRPTYAVREARPGDERRGRLDDAHPDAADRRRPRRGAADGQTPAGRPAPRPASSGFCARRRCPSACWSTACSLRLVYAPRGETSGHLTFPVQAMTEVAGRPIFAALHMLLSDRAAVLAAGKAAPARHPGREPQVSEHSSRRSWPSRCWPPSTSCSAASRRPTTSAKATCSATCSADDPNQVYAGLLDRPVAAGVHPLRRGPRPDVRRRRSTSTTTRSPACSSGCAPTPAAIPTRWTSATAPGRSS